MEILIGKKLLQISYRCGFLHLIKSELLHDEL